MNTYAVDDMQDIQENPKPYTLSSESGDISSTIQVDFDEICYLVNYGLSTTLSTTMDNLPENRPIVLNNGEDFETIRRWIFYFRQQQERNKKLTEREELQKEEEAFRNAAVYKGKISFVKEIGSGSYGRVFDTHYQDREGGEKRKLAIKKIEKTQGQEDVCTESVKLEFNLMNALKQHPAFLETFALIIKPELNSFYIVMELFCGSSLQHFLLDHCSDILTKIGQNEILDYLGDRTVHKIIDLNLQVGCALNFMHEHGIIHGDLNEDNILVLDQGNSIAIRIIDFGLSFNSLDLSILANVDRSIYSNWGENFSMRRFSILKNRARDRGIDVSNFDIANLPETFTLRWDEDLQQAARHDDYNTYLDTLINVLSSFFHDSEELDNVFVNRIFDEETVGGHYSRITLIFIGLGLHFFLPNDYQPMFSLRNYDTLKQWESHI